ncbi:MAG: hypothetical protein HY360_16915 [Verrucomicrobia bacterium]|nr:hypothetical protein [Verrucomicrobiota bacterium]
MKTFLSIVLFTVFTGILPVHGAQEIIHSVEFPLFEKIEQAKEAGKQPFLLGDRFEYWADDLNGQFMAVFPMPTGEMKGASCRIWILNEDAPANAQPIAEVTRADAAGNKVVFLVNTSTLKPGKYAARAVLKDAQGAETGPPVEFKFTRSDRRNPVTPIPPEGIPLVLEKQDFLPDTIWPVRTGVPFPVNAVLDVSQLALFENDKPVPAQIKAAATWCPKGSVKWAHLDFLGRYEKGKPADYRLKLLPAAPASLKTALTCTQTDDKITVDTGCVRFEVNRKKFAGIEAAWFDPTGEGKYDESKPVIKGAGGPYLVDGRIIRFDACNDKEVKVEVEEQGPVRVTIIATGWYVNPEGRVDPLCLFKTRITAYAGQPMIRVSQYTVITYDTRLFRLADLGFHIATASNAKFRLGADGAMQEGELPKAPATVFLHQDRYDHFRLMGAGPKPVEGKVSDGWFAVRGAKDEGAETAVVLRDIWQKFPKEIEMSQEGITLHFWPKHGRRAFPLDQELDIRNIYKFWCFHQGAMLDLNLPNDYYDKFADDYAGDTIECRPEHALNGNAQGLTISNEFELLFMPPKGVASLPRQADLFRRDPAAPPSPEWNASTRAMGILAAIDRKGFPEMEEAWEKGWLSHTRCVERGDEYGMFNYADTHTYWDVKKNCAQLHRVWHNSHYHEVGKTWLMFFRSGSPDLLRWARKSTDHFINVDTVNWSDPKNPLMSHSPGRMYHCKGLTHWGSEMYGMVRRDDHSGRNGHWADSDASLWCWYIDGNLQARDVYEIWAEAVHRGGMPAKGTRREINTSLALALTYYEALWDAEMLPSIHGMGLSLRTAEPLEKQNPGPLWHPLWINRYYEHTRDPEYAPFILKYGHMDKVGNTIALALGALAYDLSGDKSFLTQYGATLDDFSRRFYREAGDPYDWYGIGPGPLGSSWIYMQWPYFLARLQAAGVTKFKPEKEPHRYCPVFPSRFDYKPTPPSITVLALESKDGAFNLNVPPSDANSHPVQMLAYSPSGKPLYEKALPRTDGPSSKIPVPADGETGLYRVEFRSNWYVVERPLTDLPHEVLLLSKKVEGEWGSRVYYRTTELLRPSDEKHPVEMTFASNSDSTPCTFRVEDADGKVAGEGVLLRSRAKNNATVRLDPTQAKLPWRLTTLGDCYINWTGESELLLMADCDESMQAVLNALRPQKGEKSSEKKK